MESVHRAQNFHLFRTARDPLTKTRPILRPKEGGCVKDNPNFSLLNTPCPGQARFSSG